MKINNKGFVSTALIYTFFILFLVLMIFLLNNYSNTRFLLEQYKNDIKHDFSEWSAKDLNLYIMVTDEATGIPTLRSEIPTSKMYKYDVDKSYCNNGSKIKMENGRIIIFEAKQKDSCFAVFNTNTTLRIYIMENETPILTDRIPDQSYRFMPDKSKCDKGDINFTNTRTFSYTSPDGKTCEAYFEIDPDYNPNKGVTISYSCPVGTDTVSTEYDCSRRPNFDSKSGTSSTCKEFYDEKNEYPCDIGYECTVTKYKYGELSDTKYGSMQEYCREIKSESNNG